MAKNAQLWETQEIADKYLSGVRGAIPLAAEQTEVMLRLIKAAKVKVDSLLDIGCGDGILAATILEHFPDAKAVLIYNSEPMIQEAQQKLNKYKNTEFIVCDYGNKDWLSKLTNSAPFDIIVSGFSIHHQPDIRKRELYEEFYKMLKKNGLFINIEQVLSRTEWIESIFDDLFIDSLYKMHLRQGKTISRDEVAEFWFNRPDINDNILALVETQCEWLRQIGYRDVDCYFKIFELAIFGGRK